MDTSNKFWWELGRLGVEWDKVQELTRAAMDDSSSKHQMGATGYARIPGTGKAVVFNGGIDGWDSSYYIEDVSGD